MFLSIDGTLIVQIVNFIVFIILLNYVFLRPVGRAIAKRRAYIDGLTRDIEQGQIEIKALHNEADERRAAARREAEVEIAKARAVAQSAADEVLVKYQEQATELVAQAHREVDSELQAARAKEPEIVESLTQTLLERAIGTGARG